MATSVEHAVSRPILGSVDDMTKIFRSRVVDEVAVCLPAASIHFLEAIIAVAADEGKTVRVPRDPEEGVLTGAFTEELGGFLVRSVVHDGHRELERALKRVVDVVGATIGLGRAQPSDRGHRARDSGEGRETRLLQSDSSRPPRQTIYDSTSFGQWSAMQRTVMPRWPN